MDRFIEEFKIVSNNVSIPLSRIENAYRIIEKYFGSNWFKDNNRDTKFIHNVLEMVLLGESLSATEKIGAPSKLVKKLVKPINQDDHSSGLSEAQLIHKFLELRLTNIRYEPRIKLFRKRPDVTHDFDSDIIQYEVSKPRLSAFDREMWHKKQTDLSNRIAAVMKSGGSLDVYLFKEEIKDDSINKIVDESMKFLQGNKKESEFLIPEIAYLVFDPTGNIQLKGHKTSYPEIRADGSMGALLVDTKYDRSSMYEKKLHFEKPLTKIARINSVKDTDGKTHAVIIRVARPSEDKRVTQKIIEEASQLSKNHRGVVVIEMGSTSAKLGYWTNLVRELFDSGIYAFPSAVWLRSLHLGTSEFGWREVIVINSHAVKNVSEGYLKTIIPTGHTIEKIDHGFN